MENGSSPGCLLFEAEVGDIQGRSYGLHTSNELRRRKIHDIRATTLFMLAKIFHRDLSSGFACIYNSHGLT